MFISAPLQKARDYEAKCKVDSRHKPIFHAAPTVGWMNDPNGFSYYQKNYHLFYQYHPYSTQWGPMHWGHLTTKDFIRWEMQPCALAPDTFADSNGCFSGTAIEQDSKHILMYTGVCEKKQVQCVAVGDGVNYEKLPQNPVIDIGSNDFRDPKIWYENGRYWALVAHKEASGTGALKRYSSDNLVSWEDEGILDKSDDQLGKMWECPDIFSLDRQKMVVVSAQGMNSAQNGSHPGNIGLYWLQGDNNKRLSVPKVIDYGLDFYAPQTTQTPDGRRVMIAWAQNWENYMTPSSFAYSGMMSLPRELTLNGQCLRQRPVRELENYLVKSAAPNKGRVFDLRVWAKTEDYFYIHLASGGDYYTKLEYDYIRGTFSVDRRFSGTRKDAAHQRSVKVRERGGAIDLRVIMDKYIVEVFVNDGEEVLTSLLYTPLEYDNILFGGSSFEYHAQKYDIEMS